MDKLMICLWIHLGLSWGIQFGISWDYSVGIIQLGISWGQTSGATRPLENWTRRREVGRNLESVVFREFRFRGEAMSPPPPALPPSGPALLSLLHPLNCLANGWGYRYC